MTTDPAITVIVPLFNGGRFIVETLDSLAAQTVPLAEVIVVDDGSEDDGADLVARHGMSPRLIRQANAGVAIARNRGALEASSDYIAFLDQDDLWASTRHERLQGYLRAAPGTEALLTGVTPFALSSDLGALAANGDQLHHGSMIVDRSADAFSLIELAPTTVTNVERWVTLADSLDAPPSVTLSAVVRRDAFFRVGGCPVWARGIDDYLFVVALLMNLKTLPWIEEPSVLYRVHSRATSQSADWDLALLTALAAYRLGGRIESSQWEGSLLRHPFVLHHLDALAAKRPAAAVALAELLGANGGERRTGRKRVFKAAARSRVRPRRSSAHDKAGPAS